MRRPAKILFLVWGPSLHAVRRIGLFCDDKRFEVAVASNYRYEFAAARFFPLVAARQGPSAVVASEPEDKPSTGEAAATFSPGPAQDGLFKRSYRAATSLPVVGRSLHEAVTSVRDTVILRKAIAAFKPDVLFLQTLHYPAYLHLGLAPQVPRIITFWNGDVVWWAKFTGAERMLKKQIVTQSVRRAAAITVNSKAAYDACLGYGAPGERIHLIRYPGVELERFSPGDRAAAKLEMGWGEGPVVLCPRGPALYQNLDVIVQAVANVRAEFPTVRFVFLAPGAADRAAFAPYQELAARLKVDDAIIWHGNVPHDKLAQSYQAADIVISLSSEDSTPNTMLEAMAAQTPLIMGDIEPIRDWITNGENGLLVPPRDDAALATAVLSILGAPGRYQAMVEAAHRLVSARAGSSVQVANVKKLVLEVAEQGL